MEGPQSLSIYEHWYVERGMPSFAHSLNLEGRRLLTSGSALTGLILADIDPNTEVGDKQLLQRLIVAIPQLQCADLSYSDVRSINLFGLLKLLPHLRCLMVLGQNISKNLSALYGAKIFEPDQYRVIFGGSPAQMQQDPKAKQQLWLAIQKFLDSMKP